MISCLLLLFKKGQSPFISIPQFLNLSLVGNLLRNVIQAITTCLGTTNEDHSNLCHIIFSFLGFISFQTAAVEYFSLENFHISLPFFLTINLWARLFSFSSFFQAQLPPFRFAAWSQKLLPFNTYSWIQAIRRDLDLVIIAHILYKTHAWF